MAEPHWIWASEKGRSKYVCRESFVEEAVRFRLNKMFFKRVFAMICLTKTRTCVISLRRYRCAKPRQTRQKKDAPCFFYLLYSESCFTRRLDVVEFLQIWFYIFVDFLSDPDFLNRATRFHPNMASGYDRALSGKPSFRLTY